MSDFRVGNAGEIALRVEEDAFASSVELQRDRSNQQNRSRNAIARDIERNADPFHQMRDHDLRRLKLCVNGCTVHRVPARGVAAIGPVEHAVIKIEL